MDRRGRMEETRERRRARARARGGTEAAGCRECRGNAGGAAQNRVAAGSGSASRLSLAIALVRRVKVGINGRRTLLGTRGVRRGTGELEEGPSRSSPGPDIVGGTTAAAAAAVLESQVGYQKRRN